jgi:hypothetical protein
MASTGCSRETSAKAVGHGRMKKVPLRSDIVQSARDMGIGFGD